MNKSLCPICPRPSFGRGLCKPHYRAFLKYGDPSARSNARGLPFEERYEKLENGCWEWMWGKNTSGYGAYAALGQKAAHRVAWVRAFGAIPTGLHVLHRCDNPACVNPDHLFLGTHQDNMADLRVKGRAYAAKGEANMSAKLTRTQVLQIMADPRTCTEIAAEYGINATSVDNIRNGKTWSHLFNEEVRKERRSNGRRHLSPEERAAVFRDPRTQMVIAGEFGVSQTTVSKIKRNGP